ncbi:hypothetical protein [Terrimonas pollutisoli]|uniref:hypothetical protein n=1 Tax=Terrimonas pollutisoli TaxID=3034147 RepID=UPI0023ED70DD|nr:hypothetical protein [Terrimonas sp. H1YJ31]
MKTIQFALFSLLTLSACTTQTNKANDDMQQPQVVVSTRGENIEETIEASDTLTINKKAAVFYQPDSTQIEKRKKEIGEENFMIGADDYLFSLHTAHEFVDSIRLPVLEANNKRFLKFIRYDKSQTLIKLDTVSDLWGVYFFDTSKKPKLIDGTRIEEEYKSYFLK